VSIDGENRNFRAGWLRAGALPPIIPALDPDGFGHTSQVLGPAYVERVTATDGSSPPLAGPGIVRQVVAGDRRYVVSNLLQACLSWPTYDPSSVDGGADGSAIRAPINGKVARVFVAEGEAVEKGARIAVVEAMKMEHVLHAAKSGTIAKIAAREGQQVTQGTVIVILAD
jgi:3-methylcrotonyl-CoA carboxylase alpha subunit